MKRVLVSMALAGATAILLGGCVYDPYWDGPYGYGPGVSPRQAARMNDPAWCNYHPQRCAALQARAGYGAPPPGYGPPPPGSDGPPPGNYAPPPGNYGPPPPQNGTANAPPQQMQQQQ
jgi:hypothetical protein